MNRCVATFRSGSCVLRLATVWAFAWLLACMPQMASARAAHQLHPVCHAVTALTERAETGGFPTFQCKAPAQDYQNAALWYRIDLERWDASSHTNSNGPVLMVGNSRFDRVDVFFRYADGSVRVQSVETGNFRSHWRAGAQIAFESPERDVPVHDITVRFERLASTDLLRLRLVDASEMQWESTALAGVIGAALTLLAVGVLYNLVLAVTARHVFSLWQGGWAACMFVWGALWSQLALFVVPGMAGAPTAQLSTWLSCLAILCATFSAVTALERGAVPRVLRVATLVCAAVIGLAGVPLALVREGPIIALANGLGVLVLVDLLGVALCLGWACWRGSGEARAYVGAWALPMLTLTVIQFADIDMWFYGAGSQIVVLCAAAWQTLFLAVMTSRASGRLRAERDVALRSEAQAQEMARLDPLTGLRNRRGFLELAEPMMRDKTCAPVSLLLIDVDRFKLVNDTFGHDAGDEVLVAIAGCLRRWENDQCMVARLGGEEFAVVVSKLEGFSLIRFADSLRREIAACDHGGAVADMAVTVSIGLTTGQSGTAFREMYREADAALYKAKNSGRNRVCVYSDGGAGALVDSALGT